MTEMASFTASSLSASSLSASSLSACAQLKIGTQDLHDALDHHSRMRRLVAADLTLTEYAELLQGLKSCFACIEPAMQAYAAAHSQGMPFLQAAIYCRSADLTLDLQTLQGLGVPIDGMDGVDTAVSQPQVFGVGRPPQGFTIDNAAQAAGCMYVLGGASMGARVIVRALQAHLGAAVAPALHYFGGASQPGAMPFAELRAALDAYLTTPTEVDEALAKAREVFGIFQHAFRT
jgi:heme oxygenase